MPRSKNNTVDLRGTNKETPFYGHKDVGCDFADWTWGIPNKESRCEWCPFAECIKEAEVSLKDLYLHWPDLIIWLRKHRNLTYVQLGALFRLHPVSIERIIENGNKEGKNDYGGYGT